MSDFEANWGNLHVGFGPLQVTSQRSHSHGRGLPSDCMLQAERRTDSIANGPEFVNGVDWSRAHPIPRSLVEVAGIMDGAFFSV
jgi:hypothetical protein